MEPVFEYKRLGFFNHRVDVHYRQMIYRFRGRTRRRVEQKARRYMQ